MLSANISDKKRKAVYRRDGWRCALCDDTAGLQVHHLIPRSRGGSDSKMNLVTLCWRCHAAAHGTRFPDRPEWLDEEWIAERIVEYLSDLYAEEGIIWNPWQKGREGDW